MSDESDPINIEEELEPLEIIKNKIAIFSELWEWVANRVNRTNILKGFTNRERSEGEMVALMHSELSECLEALRTGNDKSEHVPEISAAEEELADVIIRLMDFASHHKFDMPKALFLKMRYNTTRPYMHGGKLF